MLVNGKVFEGTVDYYVTDEYLQSLKAIPIRLTSLPSGL